MIVRLAAISGFYDFARRMGLVAANPAVDVKRPKARPPIPQGLEAAELRRLLDVIPDTPGGKRDRAIILTAALAGLRRQEILGLRAGDLTRNGAVYYNVRVKGGLERRRELPAPAFNAIMEALEAQGRPLDGLAPEDRIFDIAHQTYYAYLRKYARRDEVVLASKVHFPMGGGPNMGGLSRKHIQQACEASLRRLGVETIDLYQIHRLDPNTPVDETLAALELLVSQGKVRYIGASSMYAWEMATAIGLSDRSGNARFATMQNHYNLLYREEEREMMPLCETEEIAVIPWSPLARGILAGSRPALREKAGSIRQESDGFTDILYDQDSDWDVVVAVQSLAKERDLSAAQIALAWMLSKPFVTAPIIGATKLDHLDDAIAAIDVSLSGDEIARLEAPYEPHPVKGMGPAALFRPARVPSRSRPQ